MKEFSLMLVSVNDGLTMHLKSDAGDIAPLITRIFMTFEHTVDAVAKKIVIHQPQKNTAAVRTEVQKLVEELKESTPSIQRLNTFVKSLEENEAFIVSPHTDFDLREAIQLRNFLAAASGKAKAADVNGAMEELFGYVFDNYQAFSFGGAKRQKIGGSDKSKRMCRFCGGKAPSVSFRKTAHAISEGLGNKTVIANEECDTCNARFGNGIETALQALLNLFKSFFGVKGKHGVAKFKGKNFSMQRLPNNEVHMTIVSEGQVAFPGSIGVETYDEFCMQDAYRALCKFAIGVLPSAELAALGPTVEWINGDVNEERLPKVHVRIDYSAYSAQPSLILYVRTNSLVDAPHVIGELRFTCLVIVFVVPLSKKDSKQFSEASEFQTFWGKFHYGHPNLRTGWSSWDLSSRVRKKFAMKLNFEKDQNSTRAS